MVEYKRIENGIWQYLLNCERDKVLNELIMSWNV